MLEVASTQGRITIKFGIEFLVLIISVVTNLQYFNICKKYDEKKKHLNLKKTRR